jgi:NitT/TauT family transport system permease protein
MAQPSRLFKLGQSQNRFNLGDILALVLVATLLFVGIRLSFDAPEVIRGPEISLSPRALPWYTALSLFRMTVAYLLSILFSLIYGRIAANNRRAERVLIPLLDVLQSVPILSFLPIFLLSLSAIFPERLAVELASILLIFTSQVWNLTFSWYQSLSTIPKELREAGSVFRLNSWMRFRTLELPFGTISLVWNSMMSWSGGWFFLMAAEIFTVGARDFRLPGLGAYLAEAASQSDLQAIILGLATLILTIITLDQLVWRPLLAWSERFKVEMVESDNPPTSWFYELWTNSRIYDWLTGKVLTPLSDKLDAGSIRHFPMHTAAPSASRPRRWLTFLAWLLVIAILGYGVVQVGSILATVSSNEWLQLLVGTGATFLRVAIALVLALAWTIPVGVAIGTNRGEAKFFQPVVQILASIPATALFPIFLLFLLGLPSGINLAAILLMLMGTQWYLMFNIIAGASAIPQDLKYTSTLMHLSGWQRWRTLILPALFPFIITGAITAAGGAWNASIVAEYVQFGGQTYQTLGVGSTITQSTASGNYALLLAATLVLILVVVLINRLFWRRLYRIAEEKYRME